jgi:hypothetical protein
MLCKSHIAYFGAAAYLALAVPGCAGSNKPLQPAPNARAAPGMENAAMAYASGLKVTAQVDKWPEGGGKSNRVTPVHLVLENQGTTPVRIQYRDFSLVGANGQELAAIPPFEIRQGVVAPIAMHRGDAIEPAWSASGFEVARAYVPVYEQEQDMSTTQDPVDYDISYYNSYYSDWGAEEDSENAPSEDMLEHALPEGTLNTGGRLDGYLYFQKIGDNPERVTLRAQAVDATTGKLLDTARIQFTGSKDD